MFFSFLLPAASMMLHTELHSIDDTWSSSERVSFAQMKPHPHPSKENIQILTQEIEDMIVEGHIKKESGPLKSVCDAALASCKAGGDLDNTLSLPVAQAAGTPRLERNHSVVRLPSPRPSPSPPPGLSRRGSTRARSVSY